MKRGKLSHWNLIEIAQIGVVFRLKREGTILINSKGINTGSCIYTTFNATH